MRPEAPWPIAGPEQPALPPGQEWLEPEDDINNVRTSDLQSLPDPLEDQAPTDPQPRVMTKHERLPGPAALLRREQGGDC